MRRRVSGQGEGHKNGRGERLMTAVAKERKQTGLTGNSAIAYAMKQINPDVCPAYPITPSTGIIEEFSNYYADGIVDTEFITGESENSALSACVGASAAAPRVMTA